VPKSGLDTPRYISAIDRQASAGDEAGSGAAEIGDQAGDLFRLAQVFEHEGFCHLDMTSCHVDGCRAWRPEKKIPQLFWATVAKIALTVADQQRQLQRGYGEATATYS
jgi:hypothetical protein